METDQKNDASGFSFIQEKVKKRPVYQNPTVRKLAVSIACGALFGLTAAVVWSLAASGLRDQAQEREIQPIEIPQEEDFVGPVQEEAAGDEGQEEDSTVYITETVSPQLEDYEKFYQQLQKIGTLAEKSLVNISAVTTDTDWFDETYTTQHSVCGMLIGDNGVELLILTEYEEIDDGQQLLVTFYDRSSASGVLKRYDRNTGLAVVSVNLSEISESTRGIITYAELGSSKTVRNAQPVIAIGSPLGSSGSMLMGNLTSVSQAASLYDGSYNILTTDILSADEGSGILIDWDGRVVGLIQKQCAVHAQTGTIQAYGISDVKDIIEHLSNNQDIVYMGIVGTDVTTAISEAEEIPVGVYVSEVRMDSPAIQAGIQPGDILTSMSGQNITNLDDVSAILLKCSSGQRIQVVCQRPDKSGYQELEVTVELKIL